MIDIHKEIELAKMLMPEFPSTMHLAFEPNATKDDKVISLDETYVFLDATGTLVVEEKMDGANMGLAVINDMPYVRNRNHVLRKGYSARKTPAQQQFGRVWTWLYECSKRTPKTLNYEKVLAVSDIVNAPVTIYGEWLYARHTISYDALPDLFVAYDIWFQDESRFCDPLVTRDVLTEAGFSIPALRATSIDHVLTEAILKELRDQVSACSQSGVQSEGLYIKKGDGRYGTARHKMVTPSFKSDDDWNKKPLVKNGIGR